MISFFCDQHKTTDKKTADVWVATFDPSFRNLCSEPCSVCGQDASQVEVRPDE